MSRFPFSGLRRTALSARSTEVLRSLKLPELPAALARLPGVPRPGAASGASAPAGARWQAGHFSGAAGQIDYKLYVPSRRAGAGEKPPLVVMLHGCTQTPDDFAAGTGMNALAEDVPALVLYPAQRRGANAQGCWNWFRPEDQARGSGEAALIAALTNAMAREHGADPGRIYVAGLSAGGAQAAILGQTYPDLFAAIGVHSGLACGAARDVASAYAAMREGAPGNTAPTAGAGVPAIIFHGTGDRTVHPRNADWVAAQIAAGSALRAETVDGRAAAGGHGYRVTRYRDGRGRVRIESWAVDGGGHAWSGGSSDGSYADPAGPDASREMLRFFLEHRREAGE